MRMILTCLACLLLVPAASTAGPVSLHSVFWEFLNSDLTFSSDAYHYGYDLDSQDVHGSKRKEPWRVYDGRWEASTGVLVGQEVTRDASGQVTQSRYRYEDGTFRADITLFKGSKIRVGSFIAPVLDLEITVGERYGGVTALYTLGRGTLDSSIARALGVTRKVLPGADIYCDMYTDDGSDYTTPSRHAIDGVAWMDLSTVPEPPMTLLALCGYAALWIRQRVRSRRG